MSTTSKLAYLNNTKGLLKYKLNSLGATITSSTTFRNYLTWLDTFYNEVSDKTDLYQNGVVGRTSQDGEPTPENPVEIKNLSGDVPYKVSGKNKLPFPYTESTHTYNGVTFTIYNDGSVLVNGTAKGGNANTKLYGNYREQEQLKLPSGYLYGGTTNVWLRALNNHGGNYSLLGNDTGEGAEIDTTTYDVGFIELTVKNGTTVNNVLVKPMVLDSLEDTTYEPYISQTFNIPLGNIELCEIDTYKDKIYSNNGRFYLKKEVEKISSYNGETITTDYKSTTGGLNTGATVYYGTTASITEITSSNYPELYAALKEIQDYLTSYKINKEFILGYSSPNIEY